MENLREMLAGKETDIFHSGSIDNKKTSNTNENDEKWAPISGLTGAYEDCLCIHVLENKHVFSILPLIAVKHSSGLLG